MEMRTLGSQGLRVSAFGLGCTGRASATLAATSPSQAVSICPSLT